MTLQVVRTLPAGRTDRAARRATTRSSSRISPRCGRREQLVYLENQFLWSPEVVNVLVEKLVAPPSDDFRIVVLLPARANDGADISRGQVAALIDADAGNDRFLACTVYAREGPLRDIVYVHAKVGIVDDRWLTVGSANLNAHSLLHDTEMNVVTHDEELARATRLRLWSEHLERDEKDIAGDPATVVDGSGGRPRPSSCTGSSAASRSRTAWCGYRACRAGGAASSGRSRATSTTSELSTRVCSRQRPRHVGRPRSTGAPKWRKRPPKAIAQIANHAQPNARPAMTSESQWTPSITRLQATPAAIAAAPPASSARVRGERRRASTSATRGVEGRGGGRVAARERRPERLRDRVERRADAVEELLDRVDEHDLADDDRDQEREDPAVRHPDHLDDADDDDHRDRVGRARRDR